MIGRIAYALGCAFLMALSLFILGVDVYALVQTFGAVRMLLAFAMFAAIFLVFFLRTRQR